MRWMLVFIFLYLIPLVIMFKNYKNLKRSCIYGSIYIVLVTTIAISNIYMSGLSKIEEALYYQNYVFDERYKDKYVSNFEEEVEINDKYIEDKEVLKKEESKNEVSNETQENIDNQSKKEENEVSGKIETKEEVRNITMSDLEILDEFRKDIYDIERVALIPMRACIPYTKDIAKNLSKISEIREEIVYAKDMCNDVIEIYEDMEIPSLSKDEYAVVLSNARNDVKKAYELREKAMESAINLLDTKNPKYIGKIMEYLKLSDNHISSFKERVNDLKEKINEE